MSMTEDRPAQQSSDWDPTVADPLQLDDPWEHPNLGTFELRTKPGVSRAVLVWGFAALVVALAIASAALFAAGLPR